MSNATTPNRLANETSPYLLQHAQNPVDWYPWGEEALARARSEDKPILLSVGYSACHWCHVMEHESFEDEDIAALMNAHFVCIKVDREERPDIDRIYQLAHQMLTRRGGGWPLTVFLTPRGHAPVFAGTYFPKAARQGMPGFADVLTRVAGHYESHRGEFDSHDDSMRETFAALNDAGAEPGEPGASLFDAAAGELAETWDSANGGFGSAPKFPHPTNLEVLIVLAERGVTEVASSMLVRVLDAMADGGLNDQLRGGFCRYCVDASWTIPHFEKMLYDNGQLLSLYADAAAMFGIERYRSVVEDTVSWVTGEMQDPAGGYYSTLDADSEGEEGKFYVWSQQELRDAIPESAFAAASDVYGLDATPNFEGNWHLNIARSPQSVAERQGIDIATVEHHVAITKQALLARRATRVRPGLDDKILTSWNALMIRGMARAARLHSRDDWAVSAERALDFVRGTLWKNGRLMATTRVGKTHLNAYLDDYVLMIDAVLELLRVRWRDGDLGFAIELADSVLEHFPDREGGGFFFTSDDHEALLHRPKPTNDDATPSGNGIAALALGRLGHLLANDTYLDAAANTLRMFTPHMERYASAHGSALVALHEYLDPPRIVVLRYRDRVDISQWLRIAGDVHIPSSQLYAIPENAKDLPGILGERSLRGDVTAYICRGFSCDAPVTTLEEYRLALQQGAAS